MPGNSSTTRKSAAPPRVAVVVSRYNASITDPLLDGARAAYAAAGGDPAHLTVLDAPGAFELTALSLAAATRADIRGVVALGCIIKGETSHDQYLAHAVAGGLVGVTLRTGVPVTFGVLTTDTPEQARDRAGGAHGNKGAEAMEAVLQAIAVIDALAQTPARKSAITTTARLNSRPDKAKPRAGGKR